MDDSLTSQIAAILAGVANDRFGLSPYDPSINSPQDLGLGGESTEYLATDTDPNGEIFNYPQIWFNNSGQGILLTPDEAYKQAILYEQDQMKQFPRFGSIGAAGFSAQNRSAMGGGDVSPLSQTFGFRNFK